MKHKELKVTKQMLHDSRYSLTYVVLSIKKGYCRLHDSCETCNSRIRFWCKVIAKIEKLQTKIINKIVKE